MTKENKNQNIIKTPANPEPIIASSSGTVSTKSLGKVINITEHFNQLNELISQLENAPFLEKGDVEENYDRFMEYSRKQNEYDLEIIRPKSYLEKWKESWTGMYSFQYEKDVDEARERVAEYNKLFHNTGAHPIPSIRRGAEMGKQRALAVLNKLLENCGQPWNHKEFREKLLMLQEQVKNDGNLLLTEIKKLNEKLEQVKAQGEIKELKEPSVKVVEAKPSTKNPGKRKKRKK